jgi:aspartate/glutamate racemase
VESDVYPKQFAARGLKFWRPNAAKREEIHQIIMD